MKVTQKKPASMIRSLMDPMPTLEFEMERRSEDGDVTVYPFRCGLTRMTDTFDILEKSQETSKDRELEGFGDIYRESQACELIVRCIFQVDAVELDGTRVYVRYFTSAQQVRESLTEAECAQLVECYNLTKAHFDLEPFDIKDAERLIDGLASEAAAFFLKQVPSQDYPLLIYALARLAQSWRPSTPPTPSSSAPSSESGSETTVPGTTGFSELPPAVSKTHGKLPTKKKLGREGARKVVKKSRRK